ncbi:BAG domain-containing protein Samui isoform X2 [Eupeodes corollae]|uniref:BAG domain-containing protein Samui isoform X2 n=1 Tax=Eupeodes corollae TaxID=290404 RepID=UPI002491837B|nr:BAG domain-containing protein Samui isoform X2 [Eupeodes corollae]
MPNSNATTTTNPAQGVPNANGTYSSTQQIPINHHHHNAATAGMDMPQGYHQHPSQAGFGSPSGVGGGGGRQSQFPPHFQQDFGFDPDIDDMFSDAGLRSHLGRMRDPFGTFGSHFPQFGSLGRARRAGTGAGIPKATDGMQHDDFFERLPPEFRQYIPDGFGSMRRQGSAGGGGGAGAAESPRIPTQQPQYYQTYVQPGTTPPQATHHQQQQQQSPPVQMRNVCDAAIQTEDPSGDRNRSEVDGHHLNTDNLNHHGLRNTVDMGVRTPSESEGHNSRSHSAPPQQPDQNYPQDQQGFHSQGTGTQRNTPPPQQQQRQYPANQQPPRFPKAYNPQTYPSHPQQPPTPQTPGGSYIRTIPIFVEGRSEPLINHKDIPQAESQPNQTYTKAAPQAQQQQHPQQQQYQQQAPQHHQNRPTPINTQQQPTAQQQQGPPPATPHTMESINKIQDIQRDVLNLMTQVEKFSGLRKDKEYAYLDEMLTRNLLKLDTIDTQGKESIRLARKEAIKCIQASINVLEAKAEENAKTAQPQEAVIGNANASKEDATNAAEPAEAQPIDVSNVHEAIPLPPPESLKTQGRSSSDNVPAVASNKGPSPPKESSTEATNSTTNAAVTKSGSGSSTKGESVAETKSE